jgi:uncharacterized membrane protein YgcG
MKRMTAAIAVALTLLGISTPAMADETAPANTPSSSAATASPAPSRSSGDIDPEKYVSDESHVLTSNTKSMLAGLNVKYAGYSQPVTMVIVTRPNMLPAGEDINTYRTQLFNQLGVGSKENGNRGVMLLIMPNARKYAIGVGDGVTGRLRSVLASDYIAGSQVIDLLRAANWDAAARTMMAMTDARITAAQTGAAMPATPQSEADSSSSDDGEGTPMSAEDAKKLFVYLGTATVGSIVIAAMVYGISMARSRARRKSIMDGLSAIGMDESTVPAEGLDDICRRLANDESKPGDDDFEKNAHEYYIQYVLPDQLSKSRSVSSDDIEQAIGLCDTSRWWIGGAPAMGTVNRDVDNALDRIEDNKSKVSKAYDEFAAKHPKVVNDPDFDKNRFIENAESRSLNGDVALNNTSMWMWMWLMYQSNQSDYSIAANTPHSSPSSSSSSDDYDYGSSSISSFSGGFDGGSSSGGGFGGSF